MMWVVRGSSTMCQLLIIAYHIYPIRDVVSHNLNFKALPNIIEVYAICATLDATL